MREPNVSERQGMHAMGMSEGESQSQEGGLSMRPPAFQLSAQPIQRHGPRVADESLRNLTAASLRDPVVLERLNRLSRRELGDLIMVVHDTAVRDHLIRLRTEAEARVPLEDRMISNRFVRDNQGQFPHDINEAENLRMRQELMAYIATVIPRMRAFIQNPSRRYRRFRNNSNAVDAVAMLERGMQAVQQGNLLVQFTRELRPMVQASYNSTGNFMRLRPFGNPEEMKSRVAEFSHEYTHTEQDAAMDARVAASTSPVAFSAADDLGREVSAWQTGTYIVHLMNALGEVPESELYLGPDLLGEYENARRGDTHALERVGNQLNAGGYGALQTNDITPMEFIRADLLPGNHVRAHLRSGPVDLGVLAPQSFTEIDIQLALQNMLFSQPDQARIFGERGSPNAIRVVTIILFREGRRITEVGSRNPNFGAAASSTSPTAPAHP